MRPLTDREQRTVRLGGIGVAIYLMLFLGLQAWKHGERRRAEYQALVREAVVLNDKLGVYDEKVVAARRLMEEFRLDPARLSRPTLVAQATAAIQQAALQRGIQLGPVRETPSHASGTELSAIQLEGTGPVPAVLRFLESLRTLGYPLITDSLQLTPAAAGPGPVKVNVTLVIPDFEQWKTSDGRPDA